MTAWIVATCAALLLQPSASLNVKNAEGWGPNPIHKVVSMLKDMQTELEKEVESEKEIFEKAMCICESGEASLKKVIDHSNSEIPRLTSKIEADNGEKGKLTQEIAAHEKDKAETESALEQAIAMRKKDATKFAEQDKMTKFSMGQLGQAIPLIEGKASAAAFLQAFPRESASNLRRIISITPYIDAQKKDTVLGFLEQGTSSTEPSAGSAQIVGILKVMLDEMKEDHADMVKEEKDAINAFLDMKEAKTEHLGVIVKTLAEKEKRVGDLTLSLSQDNDALEDAQKELDAATKYLNTLLEACEQRRNDRDHRAKMRNDEIAAISEAIKILSDDDALDTFRKVMPAPELVQEPNFKAALLQKAVKAVVKQAPKVSLLATHAQNKRPAGEVSKNANAAEKVVGFMIDNMVKSLHDDDVNDEHKKDWCANETMSMHNLKDEKTTLHQQLEKQIEVLLGEIDQLHADIKQLKEDINTNDQNVLEATKLRKQEHFEFAQEYQAMDTAVQLIDKAANRLNEFYNPKMKNQKALAQTAKALTQTSYLAGPDPEESSSYAPAADTNAAEPNFGASFAQMQVVNEHKSAQKVDPIELPDTPKTYEKKESGGVLGLMNEMKTDLKTDMKEGEIEEKHAQKAYAREMADAKEERAADVKSLNTKKSTLAETEDKLVDTRQQNELTLEEMHQLDLYLAQLHAECDFLMRNFENRHEARVDEEVGLETTETIVTHGDPPTHTGTEKVYEEEHAAKDVDQHFPQQEIPVKVEEEE